jgi:hypothetical protein
MKKRARMSKTVSRNIAAALLLAMSVTAVGASAQTSPPALTATLVPFIEMPLTRDPIARDARSQPARVNFLIEEPGANRLFISDQSGVLYVAGKDGKGLTPYLTFNGAGSGRGLFARFIADGSFASGLLGFTFDPDYARNGVFYTLHLEDAVSTASAGPKAGATAGLDASRYQATPPIFTPSGTAPITRHAVLVEWSDRNLKDAVFQGTAREVLRVQLLNGVHPTNDLTFNPTARRGDPDWRVLYVSTGDGGTGETNDVRRLNPQRLDHFGGKIIRIVPDLREHAATSVISDNGQYRVPSGNPFAATPGARPEIWATGLRNPHRMAWNIGATRRADLLAFVIGSNLGQPRYETIDIVRRGANFGYPYREGPETKPEHAITGPLPSDGRLPLRISDMVVLGAGNPIQDAALAYKTTVEGNAIAGGFVYSGRKWPALRGAVVFGDLTSGRLFYARMSDLLAATDGDPATTAAFSEIKTDLIPRIDEAMATRAPGPPPATTSSAPPPPRRIDMRLATDSDGEIYVLTKSDGMVRRIESLQ